MFLLARLAVEHDGCGSGASGIGIRRLYSRMGRHSLLGRVILAAFFLYSVCLPLDHTCFNNVALSLDQGAALGGAPAPALGRAGFQKPAAWIGVPIESGGDGSCLVCLWSQSLLFKRANSEFGVPRLSSLRATSPRSLLPLSADTIDSPPQRGPPPVSLV